MFNCTEPLLQMKLIALLLLLPAFSACEAEPEENTIYTVSEPLYKETNSIDAHGLPILKTMPENGAVSIRPDTVIEIYLDKHSKNFARFRNQLKKGKFTITLNGEYADCAYDPDTAVISAQHDMLDRYQEYSVQLLVKAMMKSANTNSDNASYSFDFVTGSALHEATHLTAEISQSPVTVDEKGLVNVKVTDDYGLPATNATVTVSSTNPALKASELVLTDASDGEGVIELESRKTGLIDFSVVSQDNVYHDPVDTQSVALTIEFIAGAPAIIMLNEPDVIKAGVRTKISGTVYDRYHNYVADGTVVNISCNEGTVDPSAPMTQGGHFEFYLTAASSSQSVSLSISAGSVTSTRTIHIAPNKIVIRSLATTEDSITLYVSFPDRNDPDNYVEAIALPSDLQVRLLQGATLNDLISVGNGELLIDNLPMVSSYKIKAGDGSMQQEIVVEMAGSGTSPEDPVVEYGNFRLDQDLPPPLVDAESAERDRDESGYDSWDEYQDTETYRSVLNLYQEAVACGVAIGFPCAEGGEMWDFYLHSRSEVVTYEIDFAKMNRDSETAAANRKRNINEALAAAENLCLEDGECQAASKEIDRQNDGIEPTENCSWGIGIHNYNTYVGFSVQKTGGQYTMSMSYYLRDYFNWDPNKTDDLFFPLVNISQYDLYSLNMYGWARTYNVKGLEHITIKWTKGERYGSGAVIESAD